MQTKIKCPKCGDKHEIVGPKQYSYIRATGEIVIVDGYSMTPLDKFMHEKVDSATGPLVYCPKVGRYFAIGQSNVTVSDIKIEDKKVEF